MVADPRLLRLGLAVRSLREHVAREPVRHFAWLPLQLAFLADGSKRRLMRAGNQSQGKTTAGLANCIWHCLGSHPHYAVPPAPVTGYIVCASWSQSVAIQEKLWSLLPKDEIADSTVYIDGRGFRGKNPCVRFKNGSKLWIKTTNQGGLQLAGSTADFVHFDEPPKNERVWAEMVNRTRITNGWVWATFTPINAPVEYIRAMVDKGLLTDHHSKLTAEAMIPVGHVHPRRLTDGTLCDAEWIAAVHADNLAHEVPIVVDGGWEARVEGQLFSAFRADGEGSHVTEDTPSGSFKLLFGADHGSGANFSSCAVLVAIQPATQRRQARIWVLDEYVSDGETTTAQDAAGIVDMLARWGWTWATVDEPSGDRPHKGNRAGLGKKDNAALLAAIRKLTPGSQGPAIAQVKTGEGHGVGSVSYGCRWLHRAMLRPGAFHVHPGCTRLIEALQKWDYSDNEWKHIIDALRYALNGAIFVRRAHAATRIIVG